MFNKIITDEGSLSFIKEKNTSDQKKNIFESIDAHPFNKISIFKNSDLQISTIINPHLMKDDSINSSNNPDEQKNLNNINKSSTINNYYNKNNKSKNSLNNNSTLPNSHVEGDDNINSGSSGNLMISNNKNNLNSKKKYVNNPIQPQDKDFLNNTRGGQTNNYFNNNNISKLKKNNTKNLGNPANINENMEKDINNQVNTDKLIIKGKNFNMGIVNQQNSTNKGNFDRYNSNVNNVPSINNQNTKTLINQTNQGMNNTNKKLKIEKFEKNKNQIPTTQKVNQVLSNPTNFPENQDENIKKNRKFENLTINNPEKLITEQDGKFSKDSFKIEISNDLDLSSTNINNKNNESKLIKSNSFLDKNNNDSFTIFTKKKTPTQANNTQTSEINSANDKNCLNNSINSNHSRNKSFINDSGCKIEKSINHEIIQKKTLMVDNSSQTDLKRLMSEQLQKLNNPDLNINNYLQNSTNLNFSNIHNEKRNNIDLSPPACVSQEKENEIPILSDNNNIKVQFENFTKIYNIEDEKIQIDEANNLNKDINGNLPLNNNFPKNKINGNIITSTVSPSTTTTNIKNNIINANKDKIKPKKNTNTSGNKVVGMDINETLCRSDKFISNNFTSNSNGSNQIKPSGSLISSNNQKIQTKLFSLSNNSSANNNGNISTLNSILNKITPEDQKNSTKTISTTSLNNNNSTNNSLKTPSASTTYLNSYNTSSSIQTGNNKNLVNSETQYFKRTADINLSYPPKDNNLNYPHEKSNNYDNRLYNNLSDPNGTNIVNNNTFNKKFESFNSKPNYRKGSFYNSPSSGVNNHILNNDDDYFEQEFSNDRFNSKNKSFNKGGFSQYQKRAKNNYYNPNKFNNGLDSNVLCNNQINSRSPYYQRPFEYNNYNYNFNFGMNGTEQEDFNLKKDPQIFNNYFIINSNININGAGASGNNIPENINSENHKKENKEDVYNSPNSINGFNQNMNFYPHYYNGMGMVYNNMVNFNLSDFNNPHSQIPMFPNYLYPGGSAASNPGIIGKNLNFENDQGQQIAKKPEKEDNKNSLSLAKIYEDIHPFIFHYKLNNDILDYSNYVTEIVEFMKEIKTYIIKDLENKIKNCLGKFFL